MMSRQLSYVKTNLFKLSDINWETTDYPPAHYHVLYSVHLLWLHTHSLIRLEDLRQCEAVLFSFSGSWQVMTTILLFPLSRKRPSIQFVPLCEGSTAVLCSGFHAVDSEFQVLNTGSQITIFSGIPDSKAQDFRFHKHKFPWFRTPQEKNLPDSRTWGDLMFMEILKCLRAEQGPR